MNQVFTVYLCIDCYSTEAGTWETINSSYQCKETAESLCELLNSETTDDYQSYYVRPLLVY